MSEVSPELYGRIRYSREEVFSLDVFCFELYPISHGKRSNEEWAREYLTSDCSIEDFIDWFQPSGGEFFETVFRGRMWAWQDYQGEWDHELTVLESRTQVIPQHEVAHGCDCKSCKDLEQFFGSSLGEPYYP